MDRSADILLPMPPQAQWLAAFVVRALLGLHFASVPLGLPGAWIVAAPLFAWCGMPPCCQDC
jgi:hypothetical protein